MSMRKGMMLVWHDKRIVTFKIEDGGVLPIFETEEMLESVKGQVPIPPHGFLASVEVYADAEGALKYATAGGGVTDLALDWSRLRPIWESDPGFSREWAAGVEQLKNDRSLRSD